MKNIDREQIREIVENQDENTVIVDVLGKDHYEKEHIKGAISLPLDSINEEAENKLDKNKKIIDYEEGIKGYKEAELPVEGNASEQGQEESSSEGSCCT